MNTPSKIISKEWYYYLDYYREFSGKIISIAIITIVASILILPIAFIIRQIFDQFIPDGAYKYLILSACLILLLQMLSSGLFFLINYLTLKLTKHNITILRNNVIKKLYTISHAYYARSDIGHLQTNIVQDTERIDIMSNAIVSSILPSILVLLILIPVLIYLNIYLFLVLFAVLPIFYLTIKKLGKKVRNRISSYQGSFANFNKGILFLIESIDLTRFQSAERFEIEHQKENIEQLRITSFGMAWLSTAYKLLQEGLLSIVTILILIICGIAVLEGIMSIGEMISFYVVLAILRTFLLPAISNFPRILEGNESLKSVYKVLHIVDHVPYNGKQKLDFHGNIELKDVDFAYNDNHKILNSISLHIPSNNSISISGLNGSGKTTILNLILGYYTPLQGQIFADDVSYDKLDIKYLRKSFGVVRQNSYLFSGTIRENLTYGNPEIDEKEIVKSLELSLAWDFIDQLPNKIDTAIGVNGMTLSGGERQRIAVARALIRKPKLLILDELGTHLDENTINAIMDNINNISFPMSLIIISHVENVIKKAAIHYQLKDSLLHKQFPKS